MLGFTIWALNELIVHLYKASKRARASSTSGRPGSAFFHRSRNRS
jgi:hypothetical protein